MTNQIKSGVKWLAALVLTGTLAGCVSGVALRDDYANYSEAYAKSSNEQLLLNLARESHEEPAYFIQLGQISSQYQFNASLGFTPSGSRVAPPNGAMGNVIQRTLTLGGSLNAGETQTPVFQYFPLTGSNFVQSILTPMSDRVFWTFYDQGWPASFVARTMLEAIDDTNASKIYFNDPTDPSYPEFLRCCYNFHNAQLFHILAVDKDGGAAAEKATLVYSNQVASLKDLTAAITSGLSVKFEPASRAFVVTKTPPDTVALNVYSNQDDQLLAYYRKNFSQPAQAAVDYTNALAFSVKYKTGGLKFVTRTFEEALNGVANEEKAFQVRANQEPDKTPGITFKDGTNSYGPLALVSLEKNNGLFAVRPILTMRYGAAAAPDLKSLVEITYEKNLYAIGDFEDFDKTNWCQHFPDMIHVECPDWYLTLAYQNRTVFTMLSYLFAQSAVDTSKLPVQQLIQVQ